MPKNLPDGYIWLKDNEESSSAECGCTLVRAHKGTRDPALILCHMHSVAPDLLKALESFIDDLHFNSETRSWSTGPMSEAPGGRIDKAKAAIAKAKEKGWQHGR